VIRPIDRSAICTVSPMPAPARMPSVVCPTPANEEATMLHMIVNTHDPESCAFRSEADAAATVGAFDRFEQTAPEHGIEIKGSWINRPAHEAFVLVDAPDAHAVDTAVVASGLVGRTHTRVLAVVPTADVAVPQG
jgi:uncharacterized protein with GYD domain